MRARSFLSLKPRRVCAAIVRERSSTPPALGGRPIRSARTEFKQRARKRLRTSLRMASLTFSGRFRNLYAGKTTLVVGSGHSAGNTLLDLERLSLVARGTRAIWATRGVDLARIYSGGDSDQLPARGELGAEVKELAESGRLELVTGFSTAALRAIDDGLVVESDSANGRRSIGPVDRIIAATGQRPDLALTRELRLELDPWLESARALGPLIDPNVHSCGSVPPHGYRELSHPEAGFYTIGIKSYGRAPTFLLLTGYEQASLPSRLRDRRRHGRRRRRSSCPSRNGRLHDAQSNIGNLVEQMLRRAGGRLALTPAAQRM